MVEDASEKQIPSRRDLARQKAKEFFEQEMVWTMTDAGFVKIDDHYQRQPYSRESFVELCLKWKATSLDSRRSNVRISEEVAANLPRLSSPNKIAKATQFGWEPIRLGLNHIFSEPTIRRNNLRLQVKWGQGTAVIRQDDFLYVLILIHLEDDVERFASAEKKDPIDWLIEFEKELNVLADQRFPGLWDHQPA